MDSASATAAAAAVEEDTTTTDMDMDLHNMDLDMGSNMDLDLPPEALRLLDFSRGIEAELDEHLRGVEEDLNLLTTHVDELVVTTTTTTTATSSVATDADTVVAERPPSASSSPEPASRTAAARPSASVGAAGTAAVLTSSSSPGSRAGAGGQGQERDWDEEEDDDGGYLKEHQSLAEVTRVCAPSLSVLASPSLRDLRRHLPATSIMDTLIASRNTGQQGDAQDDGSDGSGAEDQGVERGNEASSSPSSYSYADRLSRLLAEDEAAAASGSAEALLRWLDREEEGELAQEDGSHTSVSARNAALGRALRLADRGAAGDSRAVVSRAGAGAEDVGLPSLDSIMAELGGLELDLSLWGEEDEEEGGTMDSHHEATARDDGEYVHDTTTAQTGTAMESPLSKNTTATDDNFAGGGSGTIKVGTHTPTGRHSIGESKGGGWMGMGTPSPIADPLLNPPNSQEEAAFITDGAFDAPDRQELTADSITTILESSPADSSSSSAAESVSGAMSQGGSYLGDYCHWMAGPRLSAAGMQELYAGLAPSLLDDAEAEDAVNNAAVWVDSVPTESHVKTAIPPFSVRPVRVLEVVLRPDVPERDVMVECFKAARVERLLVTMHSNSHMVLEAVPADQQQQPQHEQDQQAHQEQESLIISGASTTAPSVSNPSSANPTPSSSSSAAITIGGFSGEGAWDTVDVQVCISRELRQRVLVMQFFLVDGRPDRPLFRRGPKRYQRLLLIIQRLFTAKQLSVSALYRMPRPTPGSVPSIRLDPPFVAQLRALCRDNMWAVFRAQTADMEAHVAEVRLQCAALAECLEPVYRQHGVAMPAGLEDEDTNPSVIAAALAAATSASVATTTLPTPQESAGSQGRGRGINEGGDASDDDAEEEEGDRGSKGDAVGLMKMMSSSAGGRGIEGCVFALVDMHKKRFQKRFDEELTRRLKTHLNAAMIATERMGNYRRRLLKTLALSPDARVSVLNKSFLGTFEGVEMLHEQASLLLYQKYCCGSATAGAGGNSNGSSGSAASLESVISGSESDLLGPSAVKATNNNGSGRGPSQGSDAGAGAGGAGASGSLIGSAMLGSAVAAASSAAAAGISSWLMGWGAAPSSTSTSNGANGANAKTQAADSGAISAASSVPPYLRITHDHVVLYFCAVIHASMPGFLYITPTAVCVSVRIPGLSRLVEAYHLADVNEVVVTRRGGRGIPDSIALRLFRASHSSSSSSSGNHTGGASVSSAPQYQPPRDVVLTPPVVDCGRLKMIIDETRDLLLHAPIRL